MKIFIGIGTEGKGLSVSAVHFLLRDLKPFIAAHPDMEFWISSYDHRWNDAFNMPHVRQGREIYEKANRRNFHKLIGLGYRSGKAGPSKFDVTLWIECKPVRLESRATNFYISAGFMPHLSIKASGSRLGKEHFLDGMVFYHAIGQISNPVEGHFQHGFIPFQVPMHMPAQQPLVDWESKARIKNQFSDGKEYFLYLGPLGFEGNLKQLLKAFSYLKKRSLSSMKLILMGAKTDSYHHFASDFETYYYKSDVVVLEDELDHRDDIVFSSYAMVFPEVHTIDPVLMMSAWSYGIPCIVPSGSTFLDYNLGPWLEYPDADSARLGECLFQMYKDEKQRQTLILDASTHLQSCYAYGKEGFERALVSAT